MIQWNKELYHYGIPRRSGRYKWGSGKDPYHHGASIPRKAIKAARRWKDSREKAFVRSPISKVPSKVIGAPIQTAVAAGNALGRAHSSARKGISKGADTVNNARANHREKIAAMTPEERRARRNRNIKIAAGVGITVGAAIAARQMYKHRNPGATNDIKAIIESAQRRKNANNWVGNNPIGGKVSSPNLHGSHEKMGKMVGAGYKESNWVNKNPIGGNVTGGKLRSTHEKMGKMAGANSLDRENARRYIRAANRPVELTSNSAKERYREAKQNMRSANKFDKHLRKDIPLESIGNADRRRDARNAYFKFSADNARRTEIYNKAKSDLRNERRENLRSAPERAITKARSTAKRAGDEAYYRTLRADIAVTKAKNRASEAAANARTKARNAKNDKAPKRAVRKRRAVRKTY